MITLRTPSLRIGLKAFMIASSTPYEVRESSLNSFDDIVFSCLATLLYILQSTALSLSNPIRIATRYPRLYFFPFNTLTLIFSK